MWVLQNGALFVGYSFKSDSIIFTTDLYKASQFFDQQAAQNYLNDQQVNAEGDAFAPANKPALKYNAQLAGA